MTRLLNSPDLRAALTAAGWAPEYPDFWSHQLGGAVVYLDEPEPGELRVGLWPNPEADAPACTFTLAGEEAPAFIAAVGTLPAVAPRA